MEKNKFIALSTIGVIVLALSGWSIFRSLSSKEDENPIQSDTRESDARESDARESMFSLLSQNSDEKEAREKNFYEENKQIFNPNVPPNKHRVIVERGIKTEGGSRRKTKRNKKRKSKNKTNIKNKKTRKHK